MKEQKRRVKVEYRDTKRLIAMGLFLLFLFSLLIIQFFRIQIVQHTRWAAKARAQHTTVVQEPFRRGVFYSNTDIIKTHPTQLQPFVIDVTKFHLHIDPKNLPESVHQSMWEKLQEFLGVSGEESLKIQEQFAKRSRSRRLAMWLTPEKKEQIETWWRPFAKEHKLVRNALFFVKDYQRSYPFGKLLGQVLHTVRELRDEETGQMIPTGGLEQVFDEYLKGTPGKRHFYRTARHALESEQVVEPPQNGADVYLTINHCLQQIAEEEVEKQVKRVGAKRGWAIMMEPDTGHILALAQYPFFTPSNYREYFNDIDLLQESQVKAQVEPFEPGSTMKALTMAICLSANEEMQRRGRPPLFSPLDKVATNPTMFPGRTKPIRDLRTHQYLNMYMALQKSSNVYMAKIIDRVIKELGEEWYREQLETVFGFGRRTGIELPAESGGLLPRFNKVHPNGALEWSKSTPYVLAMGHNVLANSFQMLRAYAMIANGGFYVEPTLVRKISRKFLDGSEEILVHPKNQEPRRVLSPEVVQQLIFGMKYVTKVGGAASKGEIHGYTEAGKTGTSEKIINGTYSKKDHISTFIGFAPADHPRFVLMVVVDEPPNKFIPGIGGGQYGGNCAAPAFSSIGRRSLEYLGVEPDDPYGYPVGDPRRDPAKADWLREVAALKALYEKWNK